MPVSVVTGSMCNCCVVINVFLKMCSLFDEIASEALPNLARVWVSGNPGKTAEVQEACQSRKIACYVMD